MLKQLKSDLKNFSNPEKAETYAKFFKTGKGEYGEGDVFMGLTVPEQRLVASKYTELSIPDLEKLLYSRIHEHRLTALLILVAKYNEGDEYTKEKIVNFYLNNTSQINNWDLVDLSADKILGAHLIERDKSILYMLANSSDLWKKRISVISTLEFIRNNQFDDALKISEMLLDDKHDLIHKAVGWMLREIGKRDQEAEEMFLQKHHKKMPRTMLRYAIEKFDSEKRKLYLKKS